MIQLMKYLGEYKKRAVMTPIWVILETVCELFLTVTIGRFIDELSSSETTMALIYEYGIRLVVIAALCLVFGTICGWESVKAASGLSKNLRNAMFDRIQDFSFTNIDRFIAQFPASRRHRIMIHFPSITDRTAHLQCFQSLPDTRPAGRDRPVCPPLI